MIAAVWLLTVLIQVIIYAHAFRHPALGFVIWLVLVAVAAWLLPRARARGLTGPEAAAAVVLAVAAVAIVGWDRRVQGATGSVDWSVVGTGWLLALIALSRPAWEWISGAVLVFAAHAVFAIRILGVTSLGVARLAVTIEVLVVVLVAFAALRPTWRTEARMAQRRALLASRTAAERAAAAAVRTDQRQRLALLETEALPLLRGIADGALDPADRRVRERCAAHAATLRAALTDPMSDPGGLLAALGPALRTAAVRGHLLEAQVVGDPGRPTPEVTRATVAAVRSVLTVLPAQQLTLTVVGSDDDVELYLTFGQAPPGEPDLAGLTWSGSEGARLNGARPGRPERERAALAAAGWQATVDRGADGAGCLEVRWPKASPAQTAAQAAQPARAAGRTHG